MHGVDTINMRSKVINGPKLYVFNLLKEEGWYCLVRGIQPVFYGYFISSFIYFYVYANSKFSILEKFYDDPAGPKNEPKSVG